MNPDIQHNHIILFIINYTQKKQMNSKDIQIPYFEQQGILSMNCGVHSLNNLVGRKEFSKKQLTEICYQLSSNWINPHKHFLGGEFDMNVLMVAMKSKDYEIKYLDVRKPIEVQEIYSQNIIGYLLNLKINHSYILKKLTKLLAIDGRHWTCIRKIGDQYWYLDSSQNQPKKIGTNKELQKFLSQKHSIDNQICVVHKLG